MDQLGIGACSGYRQFVRRAVAMTLALDYTASVEKLVLAQHCATMKS